MNSIIKIITRIKSRSFDFKVEYLEIHPDYDFHDFSEKFQLRVNSENHKNHSKDEF